MKARKELDVSLCSPFNLGARWGKVFNATLRPLYLRERVPTPTVLEAGLAPRLVWMGAENHSPLPPGFDPTTVQPVAIPYTDYATLAHNNFKLHLFLARPPPPVGQGFHIHEVSRSHT